MTRTDAHTTSVGNSRRLLCATNQDLPGVSRYWLFCLETERQAGGIYDWFKIFAIGKLLTWDRKTSEQTSTHLVLLTSQLDGCRITGLTDGMPTATCQHDCFAGGICARHAAGMVNAYRVLQGLNRNSSGEFGNSALLGGVENSSILRVCLERLRGNRLIE